MRKVINHLGFWALMLIVILSCGPAGVNKTGHEYMPDMFHSIAYEANYYDYYRFNTWGTEEAYYKMAQPRLQVEGTIPFGQFGYSFANSEQKEKLDQMFQTIPQSGQVPYYYSNDEEGRQSATAEILQNPYPITATGLAEGKELYEVYCGICHGNKGNGEGYLVREDGGVYPAQPANLLSDQFVAASAGQLYHAIVYGKNVMGSYSDKLSYKERWEVIHYIRALQAKEKGMVYSEEENTFLPAEATSHAEWAATTAFEHMEETMQVNDIKSIDAAQEAHH